MREFCRRLVASHRGFVFILIVTLIPRFVDAGECSRQVEALSPKSERGFTLMEILVTTSVIGVLLGVLVPTWLGARKAGRNAVCLSNLRQVCMVTRAYENDYECLPASGTANGGINLPTMLQVNPATVWQCPEDRNHPEGSFFSSYDYSATTYMWDNGRPRVWNPKSATFRYEADKWVPLFKERQDEFHKTYRNAGYYDGRAEEFREPRRTP